MRWALLCPLVLVACTSPVEVPHCEEPALSVGTATVSWHREVRPIIFGRCSTCHVEGGHAPFALTGYPEAAAYAPAIRDAVLHKRMPPWQPASCCNQFADNFGLSDPQIELIVRWIDQGAEEGDRDRPAPPLPPVGGLSRVDLELTIPVGYRPQPKPGHVDDYRCFLLDWPEEQPVVVSGLNPVPGARPIVHHLIVTALDPDEAEAVAGEVAEDGRPGLPCEGGLGEFASGQVLGGSLIGGDFPDGIGARIEPGSKILLNVHYSVTDLAPPEDRTTIQFRLEPGDTPLLEVKPMVLANPAWLVGGAMTVKAGEVRTYAHRVDPRLQTLGKRTLLRGLTPHMHYLAQGMIVTLLRDDGTRTCLLDVPRWEFGWEQPYWFTTPISLEPGDELQVQCTFDNTAANQPVIGGVKGAPRDIAWGSENQDMCAAFLAFTEVEE
jgi:mono/diheme cytochrome c family protein